MILHNRPVGGMESIEMNVWEWSGVKPTIFLCHATSFHGRCWDQIVHALPNQHIIAIDFRGHGLSTKHAPPYSFRSFGEDLAALAEKLELREAIGVGHSLGGYAVVLAAALRPTSFSSLLLLDPVILSESAYTSNINMPVGFILKRRHIWSSANEMIESFQNRKPFRTWNSAVLRDYCNYGLIPSQNGSDLILACSPEAEASVYISSVAPESNIYQEISQIEIPVHIVRSPLPLVAGGFETSPTAHNLVTYFRQGQETVIDDISHFIPMERPELVVKLIQNELMKFKNR
ncbi:unnamed protein product [Didymodactylos carnosus]|uniref:AB hydrolase-1 domain-containing protein n=1 Tax=Didymodactylos carnosus TaxID=1234261 RepID=A0A814B8W5_9BILA|nr:unnamed protein product [Didymodactylos carnosus]CAF1047103.1 unnamed protein product [Didymodactylos carnosus]CAF3703497.1 unnamed protein product [Didymodactylos carnosus]CAF3814946.1 unnamed protein product [Didymodactylos carnosus]